MKNIRTMPGQLSLLASLCCLLFLSVWLSGCAEPAGSGISVNIPPVDIICASTRCRAATSARAFIVYTTSGCANPAFGETVAGSAALTCNGANCQAIISSFTDQTGTSTFTIREGYYSVCAVIDFNGNYIGTAVAGQDATGASADSLVTTGSATKQVLSFTDI